LLVRVPMVVAVVQMPVPVPEWTLVELDTR